jgi:hypothetical protein
MGVDANEVDKHNHTEYDILVVRDIDLSLLTIPKLTLISISMRSKAAIPQYSKLRLSRL